jgi:hypothetical protein
MKKTHRVFTIIKVAFPHEKGGPPSAAATSMQTQNCLSHRSFPED